MLRPIWPSADGPADDDAVRPGGEYTSPSCAVPPMAWPETDVSLVKAF